MKKIYYLFISALLILSSILLIKSCKVENSGVCNIKSDTNLCTVTICSQIWMCKNLEVDNYRNGDPIPQVTDPAQWNNLNTGAWCYYNNDPAMGAIYGKLYNWYAVNDPRGLAPIGWHVPSDDEWKTLEMCIGMSQAEADNVGIRGTNEGGKLKEVGNSHWMSPNTGATNQFGFSALPGGYRHSDGSFLQIGYFGYWQSSSDSGAAYVNYSWHRNLGNNHAAIERWNDNKISGLSVRCIKD